MDDVTKVKKIEIPFDRSGKGGSHCICCLRREGMSRKTVNQAARLDVFLRAKIWIPEGARTCADHWESGVLSDEAVQAIGIREKYVDLDQEEF